MSCSQWWTCESSLREYRWVMPWNFLSQAESSQGYLGFRPASPSLHAIALCRPSFWMLRDCEIVLQCSAFDLTGVERSWQIMWTLYNLCRPAASVGIPSPNWICGWGKWKRLTGARFELYITKGVERDSQRLAETHASHATQKNDWRRKQLSVLMMRTCFFKSLIALICGGASSRSTSQGFDNNGTSGTIVQGAHEQASALGLPDCHIVVMNSRRILQINEFVIYAVAFACYL